MKPITEKYHLIDEWRVNLNTISNNIGDPMTIYGTDGTDIFSKPNIDIVVAALNDLNTRKVKRSGDTIAFLNVTGNLSVGNVSSDFTVNTNKFTVANASGNTAIAGTLNVAGASTIAALSASSLGVSGASVLAGSLQVNGVSVFNDTITLSGGTVTANVPMISASQTWNNAAVAFKGISVNIINTASADGSLLLDFQLAGVPKFGVDANGTVVQKLTGKFLARDVVSGSRHVREYQDLDDGQLAFTGGYKDGKKTEWGFTWNARWDSTTTQFVKDRSNANDHGIANRVTSTFSHEWWFSDGTTAASPIAFVRKTEYNFLANTYKYFGAANFTIADAGGSLTVNGTGSFSGTLASGTITVTGGSVTGTSAPILSGTQTWNTASDVNAIAVDVTNTASGVNSGLINLKVGGVSLFRVDVSGAVKSGVWAATIVSPTYGGTGINNGTKTITLGGNLVTSGAFNTTLTVTADTSVTLPTTGTLATLAGTETLSNKTLAATLMSGTLTLAAGTTGNAPLKFQAGQTLTTAVAHAVEWDGTLAYITNSALVRKTLQYTDGTGASGTWGISITGTSTNVTGIVALANGGTGANLTASTGGIVYSGAAGLAILAGTATANKMLVSGANAAPTWSAYAIPAAIGTVGKMLRSNGTDMAFTATTFPDATVSGELLYASSNNVIAGLGKGASNTILGMNAAGAMPEYKAFASAGGTVSITYSAGIINLDTSGTVGATTFTGDLNVGTPSKFSVAVATGNTWIGGTLAVDGAAQFNNTVTIGANKITMNATTGALVTTTLTVGGNVLMNAVGSTVTVLNLVSTTSSLGDASANTPAVDTNNTRLATCAFVLGQGATSLPLMSGTANAGTSTRFSKSDHVHPSDTSRAPVAAPQFTGGIGLDSQMEILTSTVTTATIAATALTGHAIATYRSAEYIVQAVDAVGGKFHSVTIKAIHDGVNAYYTEYASISSANGVCGAFAVDVSGGLMRLVATPSTTSSTVFKVTAILTKI